MMRLPRVALAFTGISLAAAFCADRIASNEPRVSITPRAPLHTVRPPHNLTNIRLDVKLVLIPVSVTDSWDHPVSGLHADSFRLYEDNVQQKIVSFSQEEDPVSVGLIFDTSGSMRKTIAYSVAATRELFNTTLPGDEFFLVRFADSPALVTGFTADTAQIFHAMTSLHAEGWTALLDAIYLGAHLVKSAKNPRRALFILSDGGDNNSRYRESEIRDLVIESDVRVYAIGLFERPRFLLKLAAETGGRAVWVRKLEELPDAIQKLSWELRSRYVLGYSPNNAQKDGKYRKVKVELARPAAPEPLRVSWRQGYYAPGK